MIRAFDRDFKPLWHARILAALGLVLLLAFSLAVKLVFRSELR